MGVPRQLGRLSAQTCSSDIGFGIKMQFWVTACVEIVRGNATAKSKHKEQYANGLADLCSEREPFGMARYA